MRIPRTARLIGIATLAYTAVAIAYTWPLAIRLTSVPHDLGDPLMTTWLLWWSGTQAIPATAAWWNAPMFYPAAGVFAFSEHLLGLAPIATPLTWLTHQPLIGHNVAYIATFVLSALGAHFLAHTLTGRHDVSAVAAVAYAFAPYRLGQAPHLQILASQWAPVCLAALHRYDRTGRSLWAFAAAAAWVLQVLCCGYYLFFLSVLIALWFAWFGAGRWPARRVAIALAAFAGGALLLAPLVLGYQTILRDTYGFGRSFAEIKFFGADVAGLLYATEELLLWGWVRVVDRPESNIFPGLTIVLLAIFAVYQSRPFGSDAPESRRMVAARRIAIGLLALSLAAATVALAYGKWQLTIGGIRLLSIARADKPMTLALYAGLVVMALMPRVRAAVGRRSPLAFYLLAAFTMWLLALGPEPTVVGYRALYQAPYGWLMRLPGFDNLRVPARFWMMSLVCLSAVAALTLARIEAGGRRVVIALAVAGLLLDGWPRRFPVQPAPERRPSPSGVVARLDLPLGGFGDAAALYQQLFDPKPLYNGFSGYDAPHYYAMKTMLERRDPRILPALAAGGPIGVVIDHAGDADGTLRKFVMSAPGASVDRMERDWSAYKIAPTSPAPAPPNHLGTAIAIKSVTAADNAARAKFAVDGRIDTGWGSGEQSSSSEFTIELESPTRVGRVVTALGPDPTCYAEILRLDVSSDGSRWETVYDGDLALQAYYAAVRHPKEVLIVLPIERDGVRLIRFSQLGRGPRAWSFAEIQVLR